MTPRSGGRHRRAPTPARLPDQRVCARDAAASLFTAGLDRLWNRSVGWYEPPGQPSRYLGAVGFLVAVGVVEEFLFRGYLQTRVVAVLGDGSRRRVALGVGLAALAFALAHLPQAVVLGAGPRGVASVLLLNWVSGLASGAMYELTRNVYFVGVAHSFGNTWPCLADWTTWAGTATPAVGGAVLGLYVAATLGYRRLVVDTPPTPVVRRRDRPVDAVE